MSATLKQIVDLFGSRARLQQIEGWCALEDTERLSQPLHGLGPITECISAEIQDGKEAGQPIALLDAQPAAALEPSLERPAWRDDPRKIAHAYRSIGQQRTEPLDRQPLLNRMDALH